MDKVQAYNSFWKSFDLRAYDETSVPDKITINGELVDNEMPYITYEFATNNFNYPIMLTASLWYRSTSWSDITSKLKEIESVIGRGGKILKYDAGAIWIKRGTPWAQHMNEDGDDSVRRIVINLEVEFID